MKRTSVAINPNLVYREPLVPLEACCIPDGWRHRFGCRYWLPDVDLETFYVETLMNGILSGHHLLGARSLARHLVAIATRYQGATWTITRLYSWGNQL